MTQVPYRSSYQKRGSSYRPPYRKRAFIHKDSLEFKYPKNQAIKSQQVRVIDDSGDNLGILETKKALEIAQEKGLDLIEIAPQAKPPVAKILDWTKFKYQQHKKEKEERKKQKSTQQKEVKFKANIQSADIERKLKDIHRFFKKGKTVKVTLIKLRQVKKDDFLALKEDLLTRLKEYSNIVTIQDRGRNVYITLTYKEESKTNDRKKSSPKKNSDNLPRQDQKKSHRRVTSKNKKTNQPKKKNSKDKS